MRKSGLLAGRNFWIADARDWTGLVVFGLLARICRIKAGERPSRFTLGLVTLITRWRSRAIYVAALR